MEKSLNFSALFLLLATLCFGTWSIWEGGGARQPASAQAGSRLCFAIRGNGELMPAHWGAMAQAVESFGLPSAAAGGSSASISVFLLESVLLNPALTEKELQVSFLLKSFQGFLGVWLDQPEWKALVGLLGALSSGQAGGAQLLQGFLKDDGGDLRLLDRAVREAIATGVFSGPATMSLLASLESWERKPSPESRALVLRRAAAVRAALSVLGSFDAKGDEDLFVRDGVVSFPALARLFGRMGDFYSLRGASPRLVDDMRGLLRRCSAGSAGLGWNEIVARDPACGETLAKLAKAYSAETSGREFRIHERVGAFMPALVSTAVAGEAAAQDLRRRRELRESGVAVDQAPLRGKVGVGYWGRPEDLDQVKSALDSPDFPRIEKSERFRALGQVTWLEALSLSPAEPGLSAFREFTAAGEKLLSLGGWSDLHPIPVLRGLGCAKVIYLTRSGGDSLFGQGVAKRLLGLRDVSWGDLDPSRKEAKARNNAGVSGAAGPWSDMFNLRNPRSSFSASLEMADAVVCTDWDDFSIGGGIEPMIAQAYRAPVYLQSATADWALRAPRLIQKQDNRVDPAVGFPPFSGCIPL